MTYRELLEELTALDDDQLDDIVTIYDAYENHTTEVIQAYIPSGGGFGIEGLDNNRLYLVVDELT
jgi:hypothetical protein